MFIYDIYQSNPAFFFNKVNIVRLFIKILKNKIKLCG